MIALKPTFVFYVLGCFFLVAAGFLIPLSVTGTNIAIVSAAVLSILSGKFSVNFSEIKNNQLIVSILLLLVFAVLALSWSIAPWDERMSSLHKYAKLLYIIFLMPLCLEEKIRNRAINAFLLAMILTVVISFMKQYLGFRYGLHPRDPSWIFNSHIETSYFVAFSAYLFMCRVVFERHSRIYKGIYLVLFSMFTWQEFFINDGRTGWLIYVALLILFFGQIFLSWTSAKRGVSHWQNRFSFFKGTLMGVLVAIFAVAALYMFSDKVKNHVNYAVADVLPVAQVHDANMLNRQESIDLRVEFFKFSMSMIKEHWLVGMGTGSFKEAFRQNANIPNWGKELGHPHNEYFLTLVHFGALGLFLLLYFFYTQWRITFMWIKDWPLAQALVFSFMIGCCYNAFLYTTVTGHFYVFFTALLFSVTISKVKNENHSRK